MVWVGRGRWLEGGGVVRKNEGVGGWPGEW